MARPVPFLMYHELLTEGRSPARTGEGYARYVLTDQIFRRHMTSIRNAGAVGVAMGSVLGEEELAVAGLDGRPPVVLTFDDGCASDLLVAAPMLSEAGFGATFFVTVGHLGTPGFMTRSQVRELAETGFEIGSHGMSHAYLSDLDAAGIRAELADSKSALEDVAGKPVRFFSCPGGRWSGDVARVARECGYAAVCDSRPVGNAARTDRFRLGRFPLTRTTTIEDVDRIALDGTLGSLRLRSFALGAARAVLGNSLYDRARSLLLERGDQTRRAG